jgi:hypothetical protein
VSLQRTQWRRAEDAVLRLREGLSPGRGGAEVEAVVVAELYGEVAPAPPEDGETSKAHGR